ncbi:ComF family protein [Bartonella henselae]|uniref:ComF family protein n=1 Tax=Bartonella henselae TaxID=38323 RepID=UPI00095C4A8B|nr:ComF family protein [Bartonella henselae]OLL54079.1 amidophosphoribosyltransferase [Bartonella henselae]OLL54379.1 amidophosphoribosyltransferase [Bartonella henselae]UJM33725.1 ComF family protein [Bartonella henselae]
MLCFQEAALNGGNILSKFTERLLTILYPPICPGCKQRVSAYGTICSECWKDLQFITKPYCPVMGVPFVYDMGDGFFSGEALQNSLPFSRVRSVIVHKGVAQSLVTRLKYGDHVELVSFMANWMVSAGREIIDDCDIIISVPLHFRRFLKRRYNQSAELARYIARVQKKEFKPGWLVRCRHTRPQVNLSARERKLNVLNAFEVPRKVKKYLKGRYVLLIDDVFTTGATVTAAAATLKRAGARQVDVLTFSRVLKEASIFPNS